MAVAHYGLLPDRGLGKLAVDRSGGIPRYELADGDEPFWQDVGLAADRFSGIVGVPVWVLRPLLVKRTEHGRVRVYALESEEPARMLPTDEIGRVPDVPTWDELLIPLRSRPPDPRDVPWYRPGWRREAEDWVAAALGGARPSVHRQRHHWNISAVSEVHHRRNTYFFKAAPLMFPNEARVTSALRELWPGRVPSVIDVDADRNWMLLEGVTGPTLSTVRDPRVWASAVQAYAEMQLESIPETDRLVRAGMPSLSPEVLRRESQEMLADTQALRAGDYGLDTERISAVRLKAAKWLEALDRLGEVQLPLMLEHGDFHAGQIVAGDRGPVFLDWSDAAVTVPLGLMNFLHGMSEEDDPGPWGTLRGARKAVASSFLEPWAEAGLLVQIKEAHRLIGVASPLLRALPYWRMTRLMENRWEMENVAPYFLGQST